MYSPLESRLVTTDWKEWYVEFVLFPCSVTLPNCGFTTMKFSGKPALRSKPPLDPVKEDVVLMKLASPPTSPLARNWLVVDRAHNAGEPVNVVNPHGRLAGTLSPRGSLQQVSEYRDHIANRYGQRNCRGSIGDNKQFAVQIAYCPRFSYRPVRV